MSLVWRAMARSAVVLIFRVSLALLLNRCGDESPHEVPDLARQRCEEWRLGLKVACCEGVVVLLGFNRDSASAGPLDLSQARVVSSIAWSRCISGRRIRIIVHDHEYPRGRRLHESEEMREVLVRAKWYGAGVQGWQAAVRPKQWHSERRRSKSSVTPTFHVFKADSRCGRWWDAVDVWWSSHFEISIEF